jgi:hypothetical protein
MPSTKDAVDGKIMIIIARGAHLASLQRRIRYLGKADREGQQGWAGRGPGPHGGYPETQQKTNQRQRKGRRKEITIP